MNQRIVRANGITNPRLVAALRDPRVDAIESAVRACDARGSRREELMAGRLKWPKYICELADELALAGATSDQIKNVGEAICDVFRQSAMSGEAVPQESLGEALAAEAMAECEANQVQARLVDESRNPTLRETLLFKFRRHRRQIERVETVILRDRAVAR